MIAVNDQTGLGTKERTILLLTEGRIRRERPAATGPEKMIFFFFETESRTVPRVGVQWPDLSSLQPLSPGFT